MKRMLLIRLFIFASFLILASCGGENTTGAKSTSSSTSTLTGAECSCLTTGVPVCGISSTTGVQQDYLNQCSASCYKATRVVQGHCDCSEGTRVCGTDGGDYSECEAARVYNVPIKKYGTCASHEI